MYVCVCVVCTYINLPVYFNDVTFGCFDCDVGCDTFLRYTITTVIKYEPLRAAARKQFLRLLFQDRPLLLFSTVPGFISAASGHRIIYNNYKHAKKPSLLSSCRTCKWAKHARTVVFASRARTKCNARRRKLIPRHSLQTFAVYVSFLRAIGFVRVREAETIGTKNKQIRERERSTERDF